MYNKLFTKILDSTVWLESNPTRIVWITFLACMDEDGFVALSSVGNVASRARVTMEEAEAAVRALEGPDTSDATQEFEGRRVERVPYGWMVLNAAKYKAIIRGETQREQTRIRVARHRAKKAGNDDVTHHNEKLTPSETETETETPKPSASGAVVPPSPSNPTPEERSSLETVSTPPADVPRETSVGRRLVFSPEDEATAKAIFAGVRVVVPGAKEPAWPAWSNAVRLLRERDGRSHAEIQALFAWANADSFWRANILSPATLRDKWTQLEAKRGQPLVVGKPVPGSAPRPEISCRACGRRVKTWTDGKCDDCWRGGAKQGSASAQTPSV